MPVRATQDQEREAQDMAHRIVRRVLHSDPRRVESQDGGLNNLVFSVEHSEGEFIVRTSSRSYKLNAYQKERWAMARAREAGIPVPEVLEVGEDPIPYMIMRRTAGHPAIAHPHHSRIIRSMGRCAAIINTIPTAGFGGRFDPEQDRIFGHQAWCDFLRIELQLDERIETLGASGMFDARYLDKLRTILEQAADPSCRPVLNHGDMRLKNMMVDADGRIRAVLDWESCTSNLAPQWELSLALHDLSIDNKQEFLHGYGLSPSAVQEIAPVVKALNVLNYAPHVKHAIERNDAARLELYRLRFSGALDLYSL